MSKANYIMLRRVEQLKRALYQSVDDVICINILKDYDLHVTDKRSNKKGYVKTIHGNYSNVIFTVPSENNKKYTITRNDFNKHYKVMLCCDYNKKNKKTTVNDSKDIKYNLCIVCNTRENDGSLSCCDEAYICYTCIDEFENM